MARIGGQGSSGGLIDLTEEALVGVVPGMRVRKAPRVPLGRPREVAVECVELSDSDAEVEIETGAGAEAGSESDGFEWLEEGGWLKAA